MVWGLLDHLQDQEDHYNHCNSPIKHSFTGVGKYQLIQKERKSDKWSQQKQKVLLELSCLSSFC